jgi:hypothetical protein
MECECHAPEGMSHDEQWAFLALIYGYNALTAQAVQEGHKLYCRLMRDRAIEEYTSRGGKIELVTE